MNKEFNNLSSEEKIKIVHVSIELMKTLTEIWGSDRGMELWEKISEALGNDIKGEIFFGMITGKYKSGSLNIKTVSTNHYVMMIKQVKTATGFGLKEAKDFCDYVKNVGPKILDCGDRDRASILAKELMEIGCEVN